MARWVASSSNRAASGIVVADHLVGTEAAGGLLLMRMAGGDQSYGAGALAAIRAVRPMVPAPMISTVSRARRPILR